MTLGKKAIAVASSAALLSALSVSGASPAMAAGGGCSTTTQNGWRVATCSSDNGVRVYGDVYIEKQGSLGSLCQLTYYLEQWTAAGWSKIYVATEHCNIGHHPALSTGKAAGVKYRNHSYIYVNQKVVHEGTSYTTY